MIKAMFCLTRLPSLTRAQFQQRWREVHAPLVKAHAQVLGIRRYVQTHTLDEALWERMATARGAPPAFDGVAELWWDSHDAFVAAGRTEAGRQAGRALLEDEKQFIAFKSSPIWLAVEHEIIPLGPR